MRVEWMRQIDRWVGGVLILLVAPCASLRRASPLPHLHGFGPNPSTPVVPTGRLRPQPTIVVTKYFGMGSILLCVPLLRQIRRRFPLAHIVLVSFSANQELLRFIPYVDETLCIRTAPHVFIVDTLSTLWRLRRARPDIFLDAEFFSRYSALMSVGSGASVRVGFHTLSLAMRGRLLTHRVYWNPYRHAAENFLALGAAVGIQREKLVLELRDFSSAEEANGMAWLRQQEISDRYVVCNPHGNTLRHLNAYPTTQWLALAERLQTRLGCQIVFIGSKVDPDWDVKLDHPRAYLHNLSGRTNLTTMMVILKHAQGIVSVDSGVAHLAAVFQTPTLTLFGPDTPRLYGPLNPKGETMYAGLHCSPCANLLEGKKSDCEDNVCINRWSAEEVCEKMVGLLKQTGQAA